MALPRIRESPGHEVLRAPAVYGVPAGTSARVHTFPRACFGTAVASPHSHDSVSHDCRGPRCGKLSVGASDVVKLPAGASGVVVCVGQHFSLHVASRRYSRHIEVVGFVYLHYKPAPSRSSGAELSIMMCSLQNLRGYHSVPLSPLTQSVTRLREVVGCSDRGCAW